MSNHDGVGYSTQNGERDLDQIWLEPVRARVAGGKQLCLKTAIWQGGYKHILVYQEPIAMLWPKNYRRFIKCM